MTVFTYPIPIPVFPTLRPAFPDRVRPTYASIVATSANGVEQVSAQQSYPLWEFEVPFELLADEMRNPNPDISYFTSGQSELQQLCGLFLMCRGQYGRFYYKNPRDYARENQHIGTGDGLRTAFRIMRTWKTWFIEPVGGVDRDSPIYVFLDGSPLVSGVSLDETQCYLVFDSPVPNNVVITATFEFFYWCRFIEDLQDYEQYYRRMWSLAACKFRSDKRGNPNPIATYPIVNVPQLRFGQQPVTTPAGVTMPEVRVTATIGGVDINTYTDDITLALSGTPGTLSGTLTKTPVSGTASFDDLSIDLAGTNYRLEATSIGASGVNSLFFNIT